MTSIGYLMAIIILLATTAISGEPAYTKDIYAAIHYIYPDITDNDFVVSDNGNGQYISYWNSVHPIPTDLELTNAWNGLQAQRANDYQKYVDITHNNSLLINDTATTYNVNTQDINVAQSIEIMQLKNKIQSIETTVNKICTSQPVLCNK